MATTPTTAPFDRAIAVQPTGQGTYTATVDPAWSAPMGPNGGYLAAIVVRALEEELDPAGERRMRSLTCHYLRRPANGPMELHVEPIRSGRRLTSARVTATQHGKPTIAGLAALATPGLPEPMTWVPEPPQLGPPPATDADWTPYEEGMPALLRQLRIAPRVGAPPFSGQPLVPGSAPEAGGWIELAQPRGIDAAFVALCTDVWWPPSLQPLTTPAGAPTIDLTIHFRADLPREPLPDQPVLGHFRTTAATDGLIEEDGVIFAADGTLLAQSRQLALFTPVG